MRLLLSMPTFLGPEDIVVRKLDKAPAMWREKMTDI